MDRRKFAGTIAALTATVAAQRVTGGTRTPPSSVAPSAVTPKDFGAKGDGVTDDSPAFIDALKSGATVVKVTAGRYVVKNVELTNITVQFDEGAVLVHVLGRKDVGIRLNSGARLIGGTFEVANTAPPLHGGYGCAIAVGYYSNIKVEQSDIIIERSKLICKNTNKYALALSILGAVSNVRVRDVEANGAFSVACQMHWGGTFDEMNPDTSRVTASAHPHDIILENLTCGEDRGRNGLIALSLAGVYDVKVKNVASKAWARTLLVTPGDVYAQVASRSEAEKIMTGIEIDGVTIIDPPSNKGATSESPALINGVSQTHRTPFAPTYTADGNCSIDIRNVRISKTTSGAYVGAPLVNCYYAGKVQVHVASVTGFEDSNSTLFQMRNCTDAQFAVERVDQPQGKCMTADANVNCKISVKAIGDSKSKVSKNARAITCGTQGSGNTTLSSSISLGDVVAELNAISGGFTLVRGTRLYASNGYVSVARSTFVSGNGTTSVAIEPSKVSQEAGDKINITGELLECTVSINASSIYIPAEIVCSAECEIAILTSNSGKCDLELREHGNSSLRLQCNSSHACAINEAAFASNVYIPAGHERMIQDR